jgi:hypothetical protein
VESRDNNEPTAQGKTLHSTELMGFTMRHAAALFQADRFRLMSLRKLGKKQRL